MVVRFIEKTMRFSEVARTMEILVRSMVEEVYLAGYSEKPNSLT